MTPLWNTSKTKAVGKCSSVGARAASIPKHGGRTGEISLACGDRQELESTHMRFLKPPPGRAGLFGWKMKSRGKVPNTRHQVGSLAGVLWKFVVLNARGWLAECRLGGVSAPSSLAAP